MYAVSRLILLFAAAAIAAPTVGDWKIIESSCSPVTVIVNGQEVKTVVCQATRAITVEPDSTRKAK